MPELKVIFMDAGQGDCTLIIFPNGKSWLVDCGSMKNGAVVKDEILKVLRDQLPSRGPQLKKEINLVILTHADKDHYNLLPDINDEFSIEQICFGGDYSQYKVRKVGQNILLPRILAGEAYGASESWQPTDVGGAKVYFLAANSLPRTGRGRIKDLSVLKNENSVVLLIEYKNYKFFLMGDATVSTEDYIRKARNRRPQDPLSLNLRDWGTCLKLGHHGSAKSSSEAWIKAITPTAVVVSSDTRRFRGTGMPSKSTVDNVIRWSGKVKDPIYPDNPEHNVVFWVDDKKSQKYQKFDQEVMSRAFCTTVYEYNGEDDYTGGSWHFTVTDKGLWIVYTGDEDEMVVD